MKSLKRKKTVDILDCLRKKEYTIKEKIKKIFNTRYYQSQGTND